jgi:hypothetical protein
MAPDFSQGTQARFLNVPFRKSEMKSFAPLLHRHFSSSFWALRFGRRTLI